MNRFEPLNPEEVWGTGIYSNNLYDIMTGDVDHSSITNQPISEITGLPEANIDDYTTAPISSSAPKYTTIYGSGTRFDGELIRNNTPNKVYIYPLDQDGNRIEPGRMLETNETLSVNAMTNSLFQITDNNKKCLGILYPMNELQFVSELSVLKSEVNKDPKEFQIPNKSISGTLIYNDTKKRITVQWIDDNGNVKHDGVVLRPSESWDAATKDNYLYKLVDDNGNCMGVFLPKNGDIQKVSEISSENTPSFSDYIIGSGGCSVDKVSKVYGSVAPISGPILINDTNKTLKIYSVNQEPNYSTKKPTDEKYNSTAQIESFDVLLPGEVLEKETNSNQLFKIMTEIGERLGTFKPSNELVKVSSITGVPADKNTKGIPDSKLENLENMDNQNNTDSFDITIIFIIIFVILAIIIAYLFTSGYISFNTNN
jgi:hypothetical protein